MKHIFTKKEAIDIIRNHLNLPEDHIVKIVTNSEWSVVPENWGNWYCPDSDAKVIDVITRRGDMYEAIPHHAADGSWWEQDGHPLDIVKYRVVSYR